MSMNVPYSFPAAKPMGSMDQQFPDGASDAKNKPFPLQMYGGSPTNSPNTSGYNLGTPSPPLTALSSRSISNNGMSGPSKLTMPHFTQQSPQMQQQRQNHSQNSSSQQQQKQQQQQNQQQNQHSSQHSSQHLQQQQQHLQLQLQNQQNQQNQPQQQNYAQFEQQQKRVSPQGFEYSDTGLDGRHFQENNRPSSTHPALNGGNGQHMNHDHARQMAHSYQTQDSSMQDPQLRHLQHHSSQQQQQQQNLSHNPHHQRIQMEQRVLTNGISHDPRLQGEMPQEHHRSLQSHNDPVIQGGHIHPHAAQNHPGGMQIQRTSLSQSPSIDLDPSSKLGGQTITIISKMVAATDEDGSKKKRGRPKKLILDPSSNEYIDSSHENFKKLNKLLKQSADITVKQAHTAMENGLKFGTLNDQEMKQLLESKDRRGRPRKFPVEQTGITIKGVRVNGTMKGKRKESPVPIDSSEKVQKKRRGRPKRESGN